MPSGTSAKRIKQKLLVGSGHSDGFEIVQRDTGECSTPLVQKMAFKVTVTVVSCK